MTISTTSGDAPNAPEASTYSAYITEELRRYDEHLRDVRGLAAGTRKHRLRIIGWLLEGKFKHREIVFAQMRPDDVRQFLAGDWQSADGLQCITSCYGTAELPAIPGHLWRSVGKLAAVIQNPVHWKLASLPRALNRTRLSDLLDSF
jgi:hypothetical protein